MGESIQISAADGHELGAYLARPPGTPKAGIIILQEIFGVTGHIRRVTDSYAAEGYLAMAPNLFDRVERSTELDYSDVEPGRNIMLQLKLDDTILDMAAAAAYLEPAGKVCAVGYCWGGAMADLAACRVSIDAAAAYYGRMIVDWLDSTPRCPVIYHFGEADPLIPKDSVEKIRAARPDGVFHLYSKAGHGFNCDEREDFDPAAAEIAMNRTLEFFNQRLGFSRTA
jgi:carboxymethylenebutenolidase